MGDLFNLNPTHTHTHVAGYLLVSRSRNLREREREATIAERIHLTGTLENLGSLLVVIIKDVETCIYLY
jgi:hypothetical protein